MSPRIKAIRDSLQFLLPRTFRGFFRLHQFAKGHRHIRLPVHSGFNPRPAAGIDIPTGPASVQNRQRRLHDLLEALGSIKLQQGDDCIDGARHRGCFDVTIRDSVFHIPNDGFGIARSLSLSLDQLHIFLVGAVNQNGNLSSHAERAYIGDRQCQQSGGASIGGVSALFQNLDAGRSRGRTTGNNHALAAGGDTRSPRPDRRFRGLRPSEGRE
jgi:hypothetical protein